MINATPQTIWLSRHATRLDVVDPDWKTTAQRPFDTPLADQGMREAQALAEQLAGESVDVVYASPFLRALQTAKPIAEAMGAPLRIEPGLGEWLRDIWFTELPSLMPTTLVDWECAHWDESYASSMKLSHPEGWDDVVERLRTVIPLITADGSNAVMVGHGASISCALAILLGKEPLMDPPPPPPATLFKLQRNSRNECWQLVDGPDWVGW